MEEKALFINIATILAKDLGLDKNKTKRTIDATTNYPFQQCSRFLQEEDDGLDRFVYEMQTQYKKQKKCEAESKEKIKSKVHLNLIEELPIHVFEDSLHIRKSTLTILNNVLSPILIEPKPNISLESVISLGLWKLSTDEHFEEIARRFKVPLDICHKIIRYFWSAISLKKHKFLKWPTTLNEQNKRIEKFQNNKHMKRFKNLFALMMVKSLNIFLESEDEEVSVVLQIVCDAEQRIIDCYAEVESKYDFNKTPLANKLEHPLCRMLPYGCYLIGDQGCKLKKYLIRPFENPQSNSELAANALFDKTRNITNTVLHKMTKRFNSLYALEAKDIAEVRQILDTISAIHNICLDNKDDCIADSTGFDESGTFCIKGDDRDPEGRRRRNEIIKDAFKI